MRFFLPAAIFELSNSAAGKNNNKPNKNEVKQTMDHFFEEEFKEKVLDSKIPVIMDFYADWCGPCRALSPVIERISKEYEGKVSLVKVDCDECTDLAAEMEIKSIPTIIVFNNGEQVGKKIGAVPEPELRKFIEKSIKPKKEKKKNDKS